MSGTNSDGISALIFFTVFGCRQLVGQPTHIHDNVLELVMTDVPAVVDVRVNAPFLSPDYSSLILNVQLN